LLGGDAETAKSRALISTLADSEVNYYKTCQIVPATAHNTQKAHLASSQNQ
jgi:hypothetical protein